MVNGTLHVVGIGGTTRPTSSTQSCVRFVLDALEERGVTTSAFGGPELSQLPLYAPERPERTDEARRLVAALRQADGVVIGSPGYHGTVSGLVKNALDHTEDLSRDDRVYFTGLPVGCIATGWGWQAAVSTLQTLRTITHALRGWPTPLGVGVNTSTPVFDDHGSCIDEGTCSKLSTVAEEVFAFMSGELNTVPTRVPARV